MEEFFLSIIDKKYKNACQKEYDLFQECKKNKLEYCMLFETLFKDCLEFQKKKINDKNIYTQEKMH